MPKQAVAEDKEVKVKKAPKVIEETFETDEEKMDRLKAEALHDSKSLKTLEDAKAWFKKYYMTVGHRNLGRMFIGTYKA